MAGRGQHFIPQHFQKPFVTSESKDQIWMYRRGKSTGFLVARGDSGKEHDFYSSPSADGQPTLDDLITEYEHKIFPIVDALRSQPIGSVVSPDDAAEIVVHFFIRAQHLRKAVSELWNRLADVIYSIAIDPRSVVGKRRLPPHRPPVALQLAIEEQVVSHRLDEVTGVSVDTLVRLVYVGLREQLDQLTAQAREAVATVVSQFGTEAKERIREAHREILLSSMAPPKRVAQLQLLAWTVVEHPDSAAIIPDCVCIAANALGVWRPLLLADELAVVVMPLTPNTLLLGRQSAELLFDANSFNRLAAKACFDFFLSKEELILDDLLGGEVGQVVRADIATMVSTKVLEVLDAYLTAPVSEQASELNAISKKVDREDNYEFRVVLHDFGNVSYAQDLSAVLLEILNRSKIEECYAVLDGFTFADDYAGALNSIDRGYKPSVVLEPEDSSLGVGVAMPLTVRRGEQLKTHFVVRGFLASWLLSEDDAERSSADSMIRYLLSGLVLANLERTRFSGWMLQKIAAPVEDYLYSHCRSIFDSYFSARHSASSPKDVEGHLDALEANLPEIVSCCVERRRQYRFDRNLDGLLDLVFDMTRIILSRIALVLGNAAGLSEKDRIAPELTSMMSRLSMGEWLILFESDLSHFYENIENWSDFEEIFFVNRHFERWLVFFGVIIEERQDGEFYAHVPEGIDADYLSQFAT